jgi:pilus assembly protein Flp/PilA
MKTLLKKLLGDKAGASAAEYALVLALVGVAVAGAFTALGGAVTGKVTAASGAINGGA